MTFPMLLWVVSPLIASITQGINIIQRLKMLLKPESYVGIGTSYASVRIYRNTQSSGSNTLMPVASPNTNVNANPFMDTLMGVIAPTLATWMGAGVHFLKELSIIAEFTVTTGNVCCHDIQAWTFVQPFESTQDGAGAWDVL